MTFLRFLQRLFLRPLDPPTEHETDCPWCGKTLYFDCEDED